MSDKTRNELLAAAKRQFAQKGFYGASIAQIANELKITKQALLYHFKRKEQLYAEVLEGISTTLLRYVKMAEERGGEPQTRLENIVLSLYHASVENPEDSRILMREVLDNQSRADEAKNWYLVPFLDSLVIIMRDIPGLEKLDETKVFTFIYQLLGGMQYFLITPTTLERMYGKKGYDSVREQFPSELKNQINRFCNMANQE